MFDITNPNCLPEYKCRVLNSILFISANNLDAQFFNTTISYYNTNVGNVVGNENVVTLLGMTNAQKQMYSKFLKLVDLLVDLPSVVASIPWFEYPSLVIR